MRLIDTFKRILLFSFLIIRKLEKLATMVPLDRGWTFSLQEGGKNEEPLYIPYYVIAATLKVVSATTHKGIHPETTQL